MIAFILTMPSIGSWNGKWSGEDNLYAIVRAERSVPKDVVVKSFWYNWNDGWSACVSVEKVDCKTGNTIIKKSRGFCGYNWMVDSIIKNGCIKYNSKEEGE